MKIASVQQNGSVRSGLVREAGDGVTLELFSDGAELSTLLARKALSSEPREKPAPLDSFRLCPPIPRPGKLLCLAGNYRAHVAESGFAVPEESDIVTPQIFLKPSTCLIACGEDIPLRANNAAVGWEVELAVVIGKTGRDIPAAEALNHVFGYTILNDISERRLNSTIANRRKREWDPFFDWLGGKWFDGFAPCGPWIVSADEIADPQNLGLRLWVNGVLRQEGSTAAMMFSIAEQIAYISSITRLEPGDILATGTPAGAGLGTGSKSLQDGDEIVCEIDGLGKLHNRVKKAA